jgi:hypothetical protein
MTACPSCGQPAADGRICHGCTGALQHDLRKLGGYTHPDGRTIPGLLDDLLVTATRAGRIPTQGGAGADTPDPGRGDALALWHTITNAITGWTRTLLDQLGVPCDHDTCLTGARPACHRWDEHQHATTDPVGWLTYRAHTIRRLEWADTMLTDLDQYVADAEKLIDRPAGAFRIPCPTCQRRVPIDPDDDLIYCRCGEYGTVTWWVERVAPPMPDTLTLVQIPPWLAGRGYVVTYEQVRHWADRGRMTAIVDALHRGDSRLYRPSAVLAIAEAEPKIRRVIPASVTA